MYADLYRLGRRIGGLLIPVSSDGRLYHADEPKRNQNRSMAVASRAAKRMRNIKIAELSSVVIVFR